MVELTVPEMNESIHADLVRELSRFPYLSDEYRTETGIDEMINGLFNSPSSMAVEYPGGYFILRGICDDSAELVWVHFEGVPLGHEYVRAARKFLDEAIKVFDFERITLKTPVRRNMELAKAIGFKFSHTVDDGFSWRGIKMPHYHMEKGRT
jgi:hypothetical protein